MVLFFLLRYQFRPFIKSTDYFFQLVSVMDSTFRKEERNTRKQFPLGGQSLSTGTKAFLKKLFPLLSVKVFHLQKIKNIKQEKTGFHKTEDPSPPYRMKNPFKNTSLLDKKYLSLAGMSEKWKKSTSTGQKISIHEQK